MRAVTERLVFALSTETPHVRLAGFEVHSERFFVIYYSGLGLIIGTERILQWIRGYRWTVGFRGKARDLENLRKCQAKIKANFILLSLKKSMISNWIVKLISIARSS